MTIETKTVKKIIYKTDDEIKELNEIEFLKLKKMSQKKFCKI